jgi:hypothetical protein
MVRRDRAHEKSSLFGVLSNGESKGTHVLRDVVRGTISEDERNGFFERKGLDSLRFAKVDINKVLGCGTVV